MVALPDSAAVPSEAARSRCPSRALCAAAAAVALVVALLGAAPARATHGPNVFSGNWQTNIGPVAFKVISESDGMTQLQNMGGSLCGAPTTYYHGDYSDSGGTGKMTACLRSAGHLVGRYVADPTHNPQGAGSFDVTFNAPSSFSGFYTGDDFPGQTFNYSATFSSHFAGDGCCPSEEPPAGGGSPPPSGGGSPPPGGAIGPSGSVCAYRLSPFAPLAHTAANCGGGRALTDGEKQAALAMATRLESLYLVCLTLSYAGGSGGRFIPWGEICTELGQAVLKHVEIWSDPPDPRYLAIDLGAWPRRGPPAVAARARPPKRLRNAARAYRRAAALLASVSTSLSVSANRFASAERDGSAQGELAQAGAAKAYAGMLVNPLKGLSVAGARLASAMRSAGIPLRYSSSKLRRAAKRGLRKVRSKADRKKLAALGRRVRGSVNAGQLLGAALPTDEFERQYHSITTSEIAAMVRAFASKRQIPSGSAELLTGDLAAIQGAGDADSRSRAITQLTLDARDRTPGAASTLLVYASLGLRPA